MADFQDVVRRRRMVRNFTAEPVRREVVQRIVDNARRAPSAGFTQGVELLVLDGPDETARYWEASLPPADRPGFRWPGLLRAPLLVIPCSSPRAYRERYALADKASAPMGWGVPYWHVDAAFAAELILLTAVDAGLGALFFRVFRPDEVRGAFGVPAGFEPVGAVAVGHPAPDRPSASLRRGRRPAADVVHRGRW